MRVGVDRTKYQIHIPLPPKIDPSVTMMTVEEKPDVTYSDVGGCKDAIEKLREVVEIPLLSPEKFVNLGIDPPKGVLMYGPPGTGKTLCARAVANRTDACFIRVIGSELVQKYVGEGARMVRELFEMARTKKVNAPIKTREISNKIFCKPGIRLSNILRIRMRNTLNFGLPFFNPIILAKFSNFAYYIILSQKIICRPVLFSLMKLMPLAVLDLMMALVVTMKYNELC